MRDAREPASPRHDPEEMDGCGLTEVGKNSLKVIDDHIERARRYHEQHGVWPPDPLLDEVDEMRRRIMAENGNDWRKVLQWHLEQDKQHRRHNGHAVEGADKPAGASRP